MEGAINLEVDLNYDEWQTLFEDIHSSRVDVPNAQPMLDLYHKMQMVMEALDNDCVVLVRVHPIPEEE